MNVYERARSRISSLQRLAVGRNQAVVFGAQGTGKTYAAAQELGPSPVMVARLQLTVGATPDGIVGPETLDHFLRMYDAGMMSVGEFRRHLDCFEQTGVPSPELSEYALELERQSVLERRLNLTSAVDDIERIADEMEEIARGK